MLDRTKVHIFILSVATDATAAITTESLPRQDFLYPPNMEPPLSNKITSLVVTLFQIIIRSTTIPKKKIEHIRKKTTWNIFLINYGLIIWNIVHSSFNSVTVNIITVKKTQVDANICEQFVEFTLNNKVEVFKVFFTYVQTLAALSKENH